MQSHLHWMLKCSAIDHISSIRAVPQPRGLSHRAGRAGSYHATCYRNVRTQIARSEGAKSYFLISLMALFTPLVSANFLLFLVLCFTAHNPAMRRCEGVWIKLKQAVCFGASNTVLSSIHPLPEGTTCRINENTEPLSQNTFCILSTGKDIRENWADI